MTDLERLDALAGAACECECPDCDSLPDHPRHDETPPTPDQIERARRSIREVSGSPWWAAATLEAAYVAAVRERDELRAAAQAVMDVADYYTSEDDDSDPLWDHIPVELTPKLDALRAALHREAGA